MSGILGGLLASFGASGFTFSDTVSVDTHNYNVSTKAVAAGWDGVSPLTASITINSGIYVGSTSTGTYAFVVPTLPTGSSTSLTCRGFIEGKGGDGSTTINGNGSAGGPALLLQSPTTIDNLGGTIGGGGGGGGGEGNDGTGTAAGGSGGRGLDGGAAGLGYAANTLQPANNGNAGTKTAPGAEVDDGSGSHSGAGGDLGAAGSAGFDNGDGFGTGGAAGAAVVGNSFATWINNGTRLGTIS